MRGLGLPEPPLPLRDAARIGFGSPVVGDAIVLAVSGGGDSMALLRLAHWWRGDAEKPALLAVTVDHGLRPESAAEARQVSAWCQALGVEHHVLTWRHGGTGNLSQAAREGRYRAMAEFCKARGVDRLFTGHTLDDQAETLLLRLQRGSGVDGLAAMAPEARLWGLTVARPLLDCGREDLRGYLRGVDQAWIEDPSNDDPAYDRVAVRRMIEMLGLDPRRLSRTAALMARARDVLEERAGRFAAVHLRRSALGYIAIDATALGTAAEETALRVLSRAVCDVSGAPLRPRLSQIEAALDAVRDGTLTGYTLHGCLLRVRPGEVLILREPNACLKAPEHGDAAFWDCRFAIRGCYGDGRIAALGTAGLGQIDMDEAALSPDWIAAPREARLTTPALWKGETLLAAPLAPWYAPDAPRMTAEPLWNAPGRQG